MNFKLVINIIKGSNLINKPGINILVRNNGVANEASSVFKNSISSNKLRIIQNNKI